MTPWHPHHIVERYELFTLIELGESVASATAAVWAGLAVNADRVSHRADITPQAAGAMVAISAAVFLATVWLLHLRPHHRRTAQGCPSSLRPS
ncbi:low temperature requirement protein A [Streptomyces sp. NPDC002577]